MSTDDRSARDPENTDEPAPTEQGPRSPASRVTAGVRGAASWIRDRVRRREPPPPDQHDRGPSTSDLSPEQEPSTPVPPENVPDPDQRAATSWLRNLFSRAPDQPPDVEPTSAEQSPAELPSEAAEPVEATRSRVASAIIAGIRLVSEERDRDEIIRWFINARAILARDASKKDIAKALYQAVDTKRFAQLLGNSMLTGLRNYKAANLPLTLKVALPVSIAGAAILGSQGAGVAAFGSAIGLPVVLLLFLGTAGATAIVEAFVKDRSVRDPLTKLLLALVAFDTARRARKELLEALRADALVPARASVPDDEAALLQHLQSMDPIEFERHVMSFFETEGHPVGVTPRSNDFGVDGYVLHPDGLVIVQCKRYGPDNPVGRPDIQQFKGVLEEQRALKGYFVTTSRFTREATESAGLSDRVILVDGQDLVKWHKQGSVSVKKDD